MHGSHAYLAWVAIEVCDGVYIHQLVGKLKAGDIPAEVRVRAIDALVSKYFRKERVVQGGYPMEMRYAGRARRSCTPSSAELRLLAPDRRARPCGRRRLLRPLRRAEDLRRDPSRRAGAPAARHGLDLLLLRVRLDGLDEDLPHESKAVIDDNGEYRGGARLLLSGTLLRKLMSEGKPVPKEFSKPEVIAVLKDYYDNLDEKVEVKLHGAATGEAAKR